MAFHGGGPVITFALEDSAMGLAVLFLAGIVVVALMLAAFTMGTDQK